MFRAIIIGVLASVILYLVYEITNIYRVFSKATFKFSFANIKDMIGGNKISGKLVNHTNSKVVVSDMAITFLKNDTTMGGFAPVNLTLVKGDNNVEVTFLENTKFVQIAGDYVMNKLSDYKIRFKGKYLGFIPFTYTMKMSRFIG